MGAMKITALVGLPLELVVGPCHCFLGGYRAGAPGTADADYLSYWGMANVVDGHPWLYWAHAFILWAVIITVQRMLYNAMRDFIGKRKKWLMDMPSPRATTVLVEGIPTAKEIVRDDGTTETTEDYQTDANVKKYLDGIFGVKEGAKGVVEKARVVKVFPELSAAIKAKKGLEEQKETLTHKLTICKDDEKEEVQKKMEEVQTKLENESKNVENLRGEAENSKTNNTGKAFVTFTDRRDAELAKMITYSPDAAEWVVSI